MSTPLSAAVRSASGSTPKTVAYLGNSLTVQRAGYRPQLHDLLRNCWGQDLSEVNAGLGGVGSLACAALLDLLVTRHRPDLCLVECSAADMMGATPPRQIGPSIESIGRGLIDAGVTPVFLHLPWRDVPAARDSVLAAYDEVARHLHIRTIDLWPVWTPHDGALLTDGQHLTRQGGVEVAQAIADRLRGPLAVAPDACARPALHPHRTRWVAAAGHSAVAATPDTRVGRFRLTLPTIEVPVGGAVTITPPDGQAITALLVVADTATGVVGIDTANGQETVQLRDQWCDSPRIQAIPFAEPVWGAVTVRMTGAVHADRDTRWQVPAVQPAGTVLRWIGACLTGSDPDPGRNWWQGGSS